MRLIAIVIAVVALLPSRALAWEWRDLLRSDNGHVEDGNERMRAGDHAGALTAYDAAAKQLPSEAGVHLNRGLALLAAGDLPKARESFLRATEPPASSALRAAAYYNLGLAFYREADGFAGQDDHKQAQAMFRESADALKRSLRLTAGNRDAAWNLELALRRIREEEEKQKQQEEQQKQEQQDQQQDQQQQDQQQQDQQEPQDQQQGEQQKQDQQQQDQQQQQPQDQQQPKPSEQQPEEQQEPEQAMPREAERALDALQQGEENLERLRARQRAGRERRQPTKDW